MIITVLSHYGTSGTFFDEMPLKYDAENSINGIYVKFYIDIVPQHFFSFDFVLTVGAVEDAMSSQNQNLG